MFVQRGGLLLARAAFKLCRASLLIHYSCRNHSRLSPKPSKQFRGSLDGTSTMHSAYEPSEPNQRRTHCTPGSMDPPGREGVPIFRSAQPGRPKAKFNCRRPNRFLPYILAICPAGKDRQTNTSPVPRGAYLRRL